MQKNNDVLIRSIGLERNVEVHHTNCRSIVIGGGFYV